MIPAYRLFAALVAAVAFCGIAHAQSSDVLSVVPPIGSGRYPVA